MFLAIINMGEYIKYDRLGVGENVSVAKSTYCSCRRSRFMSQHPQGSSKPPEAPVSGDLMLSSDICVYAHVYIDIQTCSYTHTYIENKVFIKMSGEMLISHKPIN